MQTMNDALNRAALPVYALWKETRQLTVPLLVDARITGICSRSIDDAAVPRLVPYGDSSLDADFPDVYVVHRTDGNAFIYALLEARCNIQSPIVYAFENLWSIDYALERNPYRAMSVR